MGSSFFRLVRDVYRLRRARRSIARRDFAEALSGLHTIANLDYPIRPVVIGLTAYCHVAEDRRTQALDCIEELKTWRANDQSLADYAEYLLSIMDSDRLRYFVTLGEYLRGATGIVRQFLPLFILSPDEKNALGWKSRGKGTAYFPPHRLG